jgi:hypothetical protein
MCPESAPSPALPGDQGEVSLKPGDGAYLRNRTQGSRVWRLTKEPVMGPGNGGCCTLLLLRHEAQCYIARAAGRDGRRYLWI